MKAPSRMRTEPVQRRSENTVEAILNAADLVFAEVGVDAATTTIIAERAGISVGSLYRFYSDKAALAHALADRYLTDMRALYRRVEIGVVVPEARSETDALELMVHGAARMFDRYPGYAAVVRHLSPARADSPAHHVRSAQIEWLMRWFEFTPTPPDDVASRRIAEILIDTTRVLLERMPPPGPERDEHLADVVLLLRPYLQHHLGT